MSASDPHRHFLNVRGRHAVADIKRLMTQSGHVVCATVPRQSSHSNERTASNTAAQRYGLATNKLLAGISSRRGTLMPVVAMMFKGGQRSLTAAASFSPSMELGKSMSVKIVGMSSRVSRTLIASSAFDTAITS
jgi:hypothetical protein